jgi:hypothetical protein
MPTILVPPTCAANETDVTADAEIIGVCVGGTSRAYLLEAFFAVPERHLVNDLIDGRPVSVSYCEVSDCARVLTSDTPNVPLALRVGSFAQGGLTLILDDRWFRQDSPDLPLRDLEFVRTTWGTWREEHPDSEIYVGAEPKSYATLPGANEGPG